MPELPDIVLTCMFNVAEFGEFYADMQEFATAMEGAKRVMENPGGDQEMRTEAEKDFAALKRDILGNIDRLEQAASSLSTECGVDGEFEDAITVTLEGLRSDVEAGDALKLLNHSAVIPDILVGALREKLRQRAGGFDGRTL